MHTQTETRQQVLPTVSAAFREKSVLYAALLNYFVR